MTETVTENADVAGYLAAVREALLDLPASDYDDLLEDLEAHLYEVVAESGGASLESSLGSPACYADELRASAGLDLAPSADVPLLRRLERRIAKSPLPQVLGRLAEQPWAQAVRAFVPTLRPAWWVLRGWLALFALVVWLHGSDLRPYQRYLLVPTYHGNWLIGTAAVVLFVVASVAWGQRTLRAPQWLRIGTGLVSAVVLVYAWSMYGPAQNVAGGFNPVFYSTAPMHFAPPAKGLLLDGRPLENIYPYDQLGHPLTGVRLFDQAGQPLQGLTGTRVDGQKLVRVLPSDAAGALVANQYPQVVAAAPLSKLLRFITPGQDLASSGPNAEGAYAIGTPMPTPTVFVPPMAGATPTPSATPSPSLTPAPVKTTPRVTAKAKVKVRPTSS